MIIVIASAMQVWQLCTGQEIQGAIRADILGPGTIQAHPERAWQWIWSSFVRDRLSLCRFGNLVWSSQNEAPFVFTSSGPGPVKHTLREARNGTAELEICATISGTYSISVR